METSSKNEECENDGPVQHSSTLHRQLTDDEKQKLDKDTNTLSTFKQNKLEVDALKNWDLFYKRNTTKFFKDRQWTMREFEELNVQSEDKNTVLLEVGCGVGNFIFPLLEKNPHLFAYACDFSPRAVQFVKEHASYQPDRCQAFQCDLTKDPLTNDIPAGTVDLVSMIFVLSAIHPDKMTQTIKNIKTVIKPGGVVLLRDYGLYDHAMLRFGPGHKLQDQFYVRQDGTRAFYFTLDMLNQLFAEHGFRAKKSEYVYRSTVNKKGGIDVPRVFVQASFSMEHTADIMVTTTTPGSEEKSSADTR